MTSNLTIKNSSGTNRTDLPIEVQILIEFDYVFRMYVIRIVSGLGILLNIFSMFICLNRTLTHHFYTYIWCRILINGIVCLFRVAYLQIHIPPVPQLYMLIFTTPYIINVPVRIAYLASVSSELALILNRLYYFSRMSKILNLAFCIIPPSLASIPYWLGVQINDFSVMKGMYMWSYS